MATHPNSKMAYGEIPLSQRQLEVVQALESLKIGTDQAIADHLGYTINRITGRIAELKEKGVIIEQGSVLGPMGKKVRIVRLKGFKETLFV